MGISKFFRTANREYPITTYGVVPSALTAAAGGAVFLTIGSPVGIAMLVAGGFGTFVTWLFAGGSDGVTTSSKEEVGGRYLVGPSRDISRVSRIRSLILDWTYEYKDHKELPLALRRKILKHAGDAAESLSRLRVFEDGYSGKYAENFTFNRDYYDDKGVEIRQPLIIIDLKPHEPRGLPEPTVIKALPAPQTLSLTFDEVKDRLERVEVARLTGPDKSGPRL